MQKDIKKEITRRDFLKDTTVAMGTIGAFCACCAFLDSMNPSKDVLSLASIEVDLSNIETGKTTTVKWQGKPVFIKKRTKKQIKEAKSVNMKDLIDPEPDYKRVKRGHEDWLVTIGICTHLGCVPVADKGDYDGWFCPCHGSQYDSSGRVRHGPAPKNLKIPPYEFISKDKIKIG